MREGDRPVAPALSERLRVGAVNRLVLLAACGLVLCWAAYAVLRPVILSRLDPYSGSAIGSVTVSPDGRWAALSYGGTPSDASPQQVLVVDLTEGTTSWSSPDPGEGRDWAILGWAYDDSLLLAKTARSLIGEASVTGEDPSMFRLVLYSTELYRVRHSGGVWIPAPLAVPGRSRYSPYPGAGLVVSAGRLLAWAQLAWPCDIASAVELAKAQAPPIYGILFGPQSWTFHAYDIGAERSTLLATAADCDFGYVEGSRFCIACWSSWGPAGDVAETRLFDAQAARWVTVASPDGEGWGMPNMSPDGRLAAWQRSAPEASSGYELLVSRLLESDKRVLWRTVLPGRLRLRWSPSCRYILGMPKARFWSQTRGEQPVLLDLAEQGTTPLHVPSMGWVTTAAWLPDSSSVLLAGRRALWTMDLASNAWHRVWSLDE